MRRGPAVRAVTVDALLVAAALLLFLSSTSSASAISVTSAGDENHAYPAGTCPNPCTLRDAIAAANAHAGVDSIAFAIPGAGVHTISPMTLLPDITGPVVINGYTQPDAHANTLEVGSDATLLIELNGGAAGTTAVSGLLLTGGASGSSVRGLVINDWQHDAVVVSGAAGVTIAGNFLGTDPTGSVARRNDWRGILVYQGAAGTIIGGLTPADRNVISGNSEGIGFGSVGSPASAVEGNYIGTDASGTKAIGNLAGVTINSSNGNIVGGLTAAARNVISGNSSWGLSISAAAQGNLVQGNFIGTDASGSAPLPNSGSGVYFFDGFAGSAEGNTIGGLAPGAGNLIAFTNGPGVLLRSFQGKPNTRNAILGNAIYGNSGLAIDLGGDGVTPNDPGDLDSGSNNLQNFPIIASAARISPLLRIFGTLDSTPNGTFTVQLFANSACDSSGYGEAERLLATLVVHTDGAGHAGFSTTVEAQVSIGEKITAAATDAAGNTSELSPCRAVGRGLRRRLPRAT